MDYNAFKQHEHYRKTVSGAKIRVLIYEEGGPGDSINGPLGRGAGISYTDNYETIPVEEWAEPQTQEFTDNRHDGSGTIDSFFIPQYNDTMPTPSNFIGRKYRIIETISNKYNPVDIRGVVINVFEGVKFSSVGVNRSARGLTGMNVSFVYTTRLSGDEAKDKYSTTNG